MRAARHRWIALLPLGALLVLALGVEASAPARRAVLWVPIDTLVLGLDGLPLITPEGAVRRVAGVLRNDLGLPLPAHVSLHLYATPEAFERGLVHDAGVPPALASAVSGFAAAAAFEHTLFFLEPEIHRGGREWFRLLAHELTHVAQIELMGGEARAAQWLAEGVADWAAEQVLDRLGLAPSPADRARRLLAARAWLDRPVPIDLARLGEPREFLELSRLEGPAVTYGVAFTLTDRLIERQGLARVLGYFAAFARNSDREGNFQRAFGLTVEDFVRSAIAGLRPAGPRRVD
jgi:hypothetical protein